MPGPSFVQVLPPSLHAFIPVTCHRKPTCTPSIFLSIASDSTQVLAPNISTAWTTTWYKLSDNIGSATSRLRKFPNRPQTCLALWILYSAAGQSSFSRYSTRPKYLNYSTPSKQSALLSPVKLKVAPVHFAAISASRLRYLICIFRLHRAVWKCFMSRPSGMCIPHMSQHGSGYLLSWTTAIFDRKFLNIKCSCSLPSLCDIAGRPGTSHLTKFGLIHRPLSFIDLFIGQNHISSQ